MSAEQSVIGLERQNLDEFEVIERLFDALDAEVFEGDVRRLAELHVIDPAATVQSVPRQVHTSIIGMRDAPFEVFQRLCDALVERDPRLLERLSYRCRHDQTTVLPWALWLSVVRHARDHFDPAAADAEFLAERLHEGRTSQKAFEALPAFKRSRSAPKA